MTVANQSGATNISRRTFVRQSALAATSVAAVSLPILPGLAGPPPSTSAATGARAPWYRRALRWGQTNINELDPARYDLPFWVDYWKRTRVQAIIVNAGDIVAYYPTKFPLHRRAK